MREVRCACSEPFCKMKEWTSAVTDARLHPPLCALVTHAKMGDAQRRAHTAGRASERAFRDMPNIIARVNARFGKPNAFERRAAKRRSRHRARRCALSLCAETAA